MSNRSLRVAFWSLLAASALTLAAAVSDPHEVQLALAVPEPPSFEDRFDATMLARADDVSGVMFEHRETDALTASIPVPPEVARPILAPPKAEPTFANARQDKLVPEPLPVERLPVISPVQVAASDLNGLQLDPADRLAPPVINHGGIEHGEQKRTPATHHDMFREPPTWKDRVASVPDQRLVPDPIETVFTEPVPQPAPQVVAETVPTTPVPAAQPPVVVVTPAPTPIEPQLNERRVEQIAQAEVEKHIRELQRHQTEFAPNLRDLDLIRGLLGAAGMDRERQGLNAPKRFADIAHVPLGQDTVQFAANGRPIQSTVEPKAKALGDDRFQLEIADATVLSVLELLGQVGEQNIIASVQVDGRIKNNLYGVTVDEAVDAIAKAHDFVIERRPPFVFVSTHDDIARVEARRLKQRKLITKVYRPSYIMARDLAPLLEGRLTEGVGKLSMTLAPIAGIVPDAASANTETLAQDDALIVTDYEEVIFEIDAIMAEMDQPPLQVAIDAVLLNVKLSDELALGVSYALLSDSGKGLGVIGNGAQLNNGVGLPVGPSGITAPFGEFVANTAGLKVGRLAGDFATFINALESITDTSVVASPHLNVLNKHKGELIIGDRISFRTLAFNGNQTAENVQFLDSGTKLLLRPFISRDGLIRMEVHPERSSAVIDPTTQLPNQNTTEVTTSVLVRDGQTLLIGGLIEETVVKSESQVPLLGSIPVVGRAFQNTNEKVERSELIILLTPRIVREEDAWSSDAAKAEFVERSQHLAEMVTPIQRQQLARYHYTKAEQAFRSGDVATARKHIAKANLIDPADMAVRRLFREIEAASGEAIEHAYFVDEAMVDGIPTNAGDFQIEFEPTAGWR